MYFVLHFNVSLYSQTKNMKELTYLQTNKYRRLYNDVVYRSLSKAGIKISHISKKYGKVILVADSDFQKASSIVLGISHTNPKYPK
jgi:hypothetical protein